jgi:hypothetical protein
MLQLYLGAPVTAFGVLLSQLVQGAAEPADASRNRRADLLPGTSYAITAIGEPAMSVTAAIRLVRATALGPLPGTRDAELRV